MPNDHSLSDRPSPWYADVTGYQWLVLVIASLGWIFDVYEGQIFVACMTEAMPELVPEGTAAEQIDFYNKVIFAAFLVGGALGGVFFGVLSDRIGRVRTLSYTILMYSAFTCLSALANTWWQMAALRFLVAIGVGGEWAVASAMVAEVFPQRARAWSLAIFHGSSVLGTYLAIAAGVFIVGNPNVGWRWGFAIGVLPALLIFWIRRSLREPESWQAAQAKSARSTDAEMGRISALFRPPELRHMLVGVGLATIGLATFWGVHVYGKNLMRDARRAELVAQLPAGVTSGEMQQSLEANSSSLKNWEMLGMFLVTTGGGIGLVSFGPICEAIGRRGAFLFFHIGGIVSALLLFQSLTEGSTIVLIGVLPVFGFLTLGMHAGYAVYFPELFPTKLRGTGAGFCFNFGRILAAPILVIVGWLQIDQGYSVADAASLLSLLFILGAALLLAAPETRGQQLPE